MAILSKVGLEAEFFLFNSKEVLIVPPAYFDRDGFPLLGEIRGKEAETWPEVVSNFMSKQMEILASLRKGHSIKTLDFFKVPLKTYKEANRQIDEPKEGALDLIKNVYGTDITNFTDQVISKGRIQGINASCGLHVHFSCNEEVVWEYKKQKYEMVDLPIHLPGLLSAVHDNAISAPQAAGLKELIQPSIYLYKDEGYEEDKKIEVRASRLNKAAIEYIVKEMDKEFFDRFAPAEAKRTKYRSPGFFEIKPYGFEYRSLPANDKSMAALPEIAQKAFDLLKEINKY